MMLIAVKSKKEGTVKVKQAIRILNELGSSKLANNIEQYLKLIEESELDKLFNIV
jgi:hypothetical protein